MIQPACLYKTELEELFATYVYSDKYFYYTGSAHCHELPNFDLSDYDYKYAIRDSQNEVIGYISYSVDVDNDCAYDITAFSFRIGKYEMGKALSEIMEKLVKMYHRVEWKMIGGNPIKKHYDEFCEKHNGNVVVLRDTVKDSAGKYHNTYIYEIVKQTNLYEEYCRNDVEALRAVFSREE